MLALERDKHTRDQKTIAKQAKTIAMLSDHVERVMGAMRSYVEAKLASDAKAKQLRTATHRLRTVIDKQQLAIAVHQQLIASLRDTGSTMERQLFDMDRRYGDMKTALQQLRRHHAESLATAAAHARLQAQVKSQAPIQTQPQTSQHQHQHSHPYPHPQQHQHQQQEHQQHQHQQQERRMKRVASLRSATGQQTTAVPAAPTTPPVSSTGCAPPEGRGVGEGSEQYGSESFEEASRQGEMQGQEQVRRQGQGQGQGHWQQQRQEEVQKQPPKQVHGPIQIQIQGQGQVRTEESTVSEELFLNSPNAKVSV